jgi:predicted NBD/HSP70 family sugar kinase
VKVTMTTIVSRQGMREVNSEQVLRVILREGPLARVDLARYVGLTTAAISNITRELIENGLLSEIGMARGHRVGAKSILLDFPEHGIVLGVVHQGVSALRVALSTLRGRIIGRRVIATPDRYTPAWAVEAIVQALHELLSAHGYTDNELIAIGVGLVGLIDTGQGIVKRAPSIGWEHIPIRAMLEQRFTCSVAVENNVRAMALGEVLLGAGQGWPDFAFVYIGTGIGSGLIINGQLYRGSHGGAGEIGHITVDPKGEQCSCGNYGCLETIVAEPAIVHSARLHGIVVDTPDGGTKETVRKLALLARQGDETACTVIATCGESLGLALATLVDILNSSHIVLHGAITLAGDTFFSSVEQCVRQRAFLSRDETVTLAAPTFGDDAGLVGAAAVALDTFILNGALKGVSG